MRYAQIRDFDISNGDGLGVALFVQGCHFKCKNCFNQATWDFSKGIEWTEKTQNVFLQSISQSFIQRVSILGGEPLADENVETIYNLLKIVKEKFPDKKIWIYSGYVFENLHLGKQHSLEIKNVHYDIIRDKILSLCDVLVDGLYVEALKDFNLQFKGSSNQRVIDVKETLLNNKIILKYN